MLALSDSEPEGHVEGEADTEPLGVTVAESLRDTEPEPLTERAAVLLRVRAGLREPVGLVEAQDETDTEEDVVRDTDEELLTLREPGEEPLLDGDALAHTVVVTEGVARGERVATAERDGEPEEVAAPGVPVGHPEGVAETVRKTVAEGLADGHGDELEPALGDVPLLELAVPHGDCVGAKPL